MRSWFSDLSEMTLRLISSLLPLGFLLLSPVQAQEKKPVVEKSIASDPREKAVPPTRNTTTGKTFEEELRKSLLALGYKVAEQVQVGTRPNGSKHMIDLVATKGGHSYLISLKWQQTSGTAEQKVPYEVICLSEALKQSRGAHRAAYLVLGGEGWSLKEFYLAGGLRRHLSLDQQVEILSPETLLLRAREGKL
ncbi:PD-(D/E)XK nuclease superfamily protein [Roseibacillus persicicus]|uniref:PD-(D/E)XK nuclease domain-containing protein n=2 Tax=Roseibacillus persicicus TaxID=454148 RepID=A0A918TBG0_9BACT|nr:hypothetical protein GCM10007100_02660 [Roseibacillus persicicus]